MAGVSRSVTLVIAFLMRNRQIGYQDAFDLVKRRRKIVFHMAFRSVRILHFWSSCNNTSLRCCRPSKNCRTSQLVRAGTLPNRPKCNQRPLIKQITISASSNQSTTSSSCVPASLKNDSPHFPSYNINEENIHRFEQIKMPLQDVPCPLLPVQLSLTHQVRSNGPHERLPIKIRRVFPSL